MVKSGSVMGGEALSELVGSLVERAMRAGATDAEATTLESDEFFVKVRLGHVDTLTESVSRAVGLRVFNGRRTASTSTNDLSEASLERLVSGAVELAKLTEEDPLRRSGGPCRILDQARWRGNGPVLRRCVLAACGGAN